MPKGKFNTVSGVFVPSVLAIFGAVLYYVAPRVLGGVGLINMMLIILIAHLITIATAFSISAIATNIYVKGGGLYYLISRSLGTEFGGSMGIQLFFAQTISIGFYAIAFSKAVVGILSAYDIFWSWKLIAVCSFIIFWIIAFIGADFVIKLQYGILGVILASFVSIFLSPNRIPTANEFLGVGGEHLAFWVAFAMFFPAVTGMDAGVAMSGDLKDPRKSLVRGSFSAILITMFLYLAIAVKYFYSADLAALSGNLYIVQTFSAIPWMVILGVLLSTSSSALSYLMAAPRTLRALGKDNIFGKRWTFLKKGIGQSNEPRIAMFATLIIGIIVIVSGDLFLVSQMVAIFFLNVYGWINGAAFLEKISKNPSFRPSFNPPAAFSFIGMVACYLVMYLFNPIIMFISIALQLVIFGLLVITKTSSKLESVWQGVLFQLFRVILRRMEEAEESKKNWRPTIVSFCINEDNKSTMANLLNWIGGGTGITNMYYLIPRSFKTYGKERDEIENDIMEYVKDYKLNIYPKVILCNDYNESVKAVMQSDTLGNLPHNTVLIDFDERFKTDEILNTCVSLKKNVVILRNRAGFSDFKTIDIWWDGSDNGNMMLLLSYLISNSKRWNENYVEITLYKIARTKEDEEKSKTELAKVIENARIDNVNVEVIMNKKKPVKDFIYEKSHNSDLVMIGMPITGKNGVATKGLHKEIKKHTDRLKTSLIVFSSQKVDLRIN
ncbi:amino acid permease [Candidatus Woesearchaeota archaeon]|nr:amino acid permease [Candidatus Woesearchaeota archaeon]